MGTILASDNHITYYWDSLAVLSSIMGYDTELSGGPEDYYDLESLELKFRPIGKEFIDASIKFDSARIVPTDQFEESKWMYYGTNVFTAGAPDYAALKSGNSGVYVDYHSVCIFEPGHYMIAVEVDGTNISGGGDVQFDITLENASASETFTFPVHSYQAQPLSARWLRFEVTELWASMYLKFDNVVWNGTGEARLSGFTIYKSSPSWTIEKDALFKAAAYTELRDRNVIICTSNEINIKDLSFETETAKLFTFDNIYYPAYAIGPSSFRTYKLVLQQQGVPFEDFTLIDEYRINRIPPGVSGPTNLFSDISFVHPAINISSNPDFPADNRAGPRRFTYNSSVGEDVTINICPPVPGTIGGDRVSVMAGLLHVARCRVRIPQISGIGASTVPYSFQVINVNDGSVIASVPRSLIDQASDYLFVEALEFTPPADCNTVIIEVNINQTATTAQAIIYTDGYMLMNAAAPGSVQFYSSLEMSPRAILLQTGSSEVSQEWTNAEWQDIPGTRGANYTVIGNPSSRPVADGGPPGVFTDGENSNIDSIYWVADRPHQPIAMHDDLGYIQILFDEWNNRIRPVLQANSLTEPDVTDWVALLEQKGEVGIVPENSDLLWSDGAGELERQYAIINQLVKMLGAVSYRGSVVSLPINTVIGDANTDYSYTEFTLTRSAHLMLRWASILRNTANFFATDDIIRWYVEIDGVQVISENDGIITSVEAAGGSDGEVPFAIDLPLGEFLEGDHTMKIYKQVDASASGVVISQSLRQPDPNTPASAILSPYKETYAARLEISYL